MSKIDLAKQSKMFYNKGCGYLVKKVGVKTRYSLPTEQTVLVDRKIFYKN